MSKIVNNIIADLAKARREKGISQFGLALKLGVTPSWIASLERAENANLKTVQKVAKELGCEIVVVRGPEWQEMKK